MSDIEQLLDRDAKMVLRYESQIARGEYPGLLTPDDDDTLQESWDRATGQLGLARTNVFTGEPLPPLTIRTRFRRWGAARGRFASFAGKAMALLCGLGLWTGGSTLMRVLDAKWAHRHITPELLRAADTTITNINAAGLPTVPAVVVPPVGGAAGATAVSLPDGTRIFLAPGSQLSWKRITEGAQDRMVAELRGEARFEMTRQSRMLGVRTPSAKMAAIAGSGASFAVRGMDDETVVTAFRARVDVFAGLGNFVHSEQVHAGQSVIVRKGENRPRFVKAVPR